MCLDNLGRISYSTEFERYQFQHAVRAKYHFNKLADEIGTIKKFDSNKNSDDHGDKHV